MQEKQSSSNWGLLIFLIITGTCSLMLISHCAGAALLHLSNTEPGLLMVDAVLSMVGMVWVMVVSNNAKSPEVRAREAQEEVQEAQKKAYANEDPMKPLPRRYPVIYPVAFSGVLAGLKEPIFVGGSPRAWVVSLEDRDNAVIQGMFTHGERPNVTTLCASIKFAQLDQETKVIFQFENQSVLAPTDGAELIKITLNNITGVMSPAFPPGTNWIVEVPDFPMSDRALRAVEWKPAHDAQIAILGVITLLGIFVGAGWWCVSTFFSSKPVEESSQLSR